MSLIDFKQRLAELEAATERTEAAVGRLSNKINNVKGPMDDMVDQAMKVGSAVGRVGGQVIELVRMSGEVKPTLEGVVWQLYEVQKAAKETETVSRDVLDRIVPLIDSLAPHFQLWLKKILQMGADGELTLAELQQKIDDFATSVGATQLNSMFHDDLPGFVIEFRKLMEEIKRGEKTLDEAGAALDEITGKAKTATKEVEKTRNTVAGMTKGSKGGSLGASSGGEAGGATAGITAAGLAAALGSVAGRTK